MGRQLLLGALRHADGRKMKVSLSQAFRVLEVEVTFKTCVTDEARTAGNRLPRLLLSTKSIYFSQTTPRLRPALSALGNNRKWIIKH
jgi:hypothetical protein